MKAFNTSNEYQRYPPSILIVKDSSACTCKLKQTLETNGCQVYQIDICCLDTTQQEYFDLVVFDLEEPEKVIDDINLSAPALAETPLVLFNSAAQGDAAESLLPLIKQKHYITYRYM